MTTREQQRHPVSWISATLFFQARTRYVGTVTTTLGLVFMCLLACSPTAPSAQGTPPPSAVVHDSAVWSVTASAGLELHVRNLSHTDTIRGEFEGCPLVMLEAYREGDWETPAWQRPASEFVCTADEGAFNHPVVAPGDSAVVGHRSGTDAQEVLGDSLDSGLYRLGARRIPLDSLPTDAGPETLRNWNPMRVELVAPEPIQLDR